MTTPFRQLESVTSYTADGVTTAWNFSFSSGYLDKAHVKAYQLSPLGARTDIPVTLSMFAGAYQLTITPAIPAGYELTIYRDTPTAAPLVDFTDTAAFTEVALDTVVKQATFAAAETQDALSVASARIDQIGSFAQGAQDAQTAANASKLAAAQSATDAATSAGNALGSANAAAASAASVVATNLVHLAGAETITGVKTFSAQPVGITATSVGLGNVNNTSDANKPTSTAQAASIATAVAAVCGFKNKIRNPKMDIAQRGTSFGAAPSGAYTLDGYLWVNTGTGVVTISQQADAPAGAEYQNSLRVTVTTADAAVAASDLAHLRQSIEGYLVRDLLGNNIAIQFDVRSAKTGTHSLAIRNSGGDRSYVMTYTVNAANTWEHKVLLLPGGLITAGTWNWLNGVGISVEWALYAGTTWQAPANGAWQTGDYRASAGQVNCMDTVGNVFAIGGIQLERDRGQGATALEHRDMASELAFNQRYYETFTSPAYYIQGSTATGMYVPMYLRVTKRALPTVTLPSATNAIYNSAGGNSTPSPWTTSSVGLDSFAVNAGAASGGISGMPPSIFGVSAEL